MSHQVAAEPIASLAPVATTGARVGFIVGPTGVGKSALALEVAQQLDAEIVNADSRQVYREMDIGTAKPTDAERRRVRHHLINIRSPNEPIDAAEFARLGREAIADVLARGRPALVAGGSGLYLRVLRDGLFPGPPASPKIRAELNEFADRRGIPALHTKLAAIDPEAASRISPNDRQRIVRALEVFRVTGIPISAHHANHRFASPAYASLTIGVTLPRELLYAAIDRRFTTMVEVGFIDEVRRLIARGYDPAASPLASIGYREIAQYLSGAIDSRTAIADAQRATRQLAKRQLTWFRADPAITWLDARSAFEPALELFQKFFDRQKLSDG
jgi:tRNA dimethylallyltransferase